jgi:hypothetical protein
MTKTHKKKKEKAASTRWKAPNKPKKQVTAARAAEQVAKRPVPMTNVEGSPPRLPFAFWPLEVMKWWWMPSTTRS